MLSCLASPSARISPVLFMKQLKYLSSVMFPLLRYISSTDNVVRGKKGTGGVHCAKTKTTLILGIYDDSIQPGQAASVVEKMADYLIENNC